MNTTWSTKTFSAPPASPEAPASSEAPASPEAPESLFCAPPSVAPPDPMMTLPAVPPELLVLPALPVPACEDAPAVAPADPDAPLRFPLDLELHALTNAQAKHSTTPSRPMLDFGIQSRYVSIRRMPKSSLLAGRSGRRLLLPLRKRSEPDAQLGRSESKGALWVWGPRGAWVRDGLSRLLALESVSARDTENERKIS